MIVANYGWRLMFIVIGGASMLWLIPWAYVATHARRLEARDSRQDHAEGPHTMEILGQPSAWGTFLCLFCGNYAWYFLLTWLPWYLIRERHFSTERMGNFGSLAFWAVALTSLSSGWLSDRLLSEADRRRS